MTKVIKGRRYQINRLWWVLLISSRYYTDRATQTATHLLSDWRLCGSVGRIPHYRWEGHAFESNYGRILVLILILLIFIHWEWSKKKISSHGGIPTHAIQVPSRMFHHSALGLLLLIPILSIKAREYNVVYVSTLSLTKGIGNQRTRDQKTNSRLLPCSGLETQQW